jgi:ferredoxin
MQHQVMVINGDTSVELLASDGVNLRRLLLDAGLSPYSAVTRRFNCGGRGLCATCGVWIDMGEPDPVHWHDRIGNRFGYPRLSCQVVVRTNMVVRLITDKGIWT